MSPRLGRVLKGVAALLLALPLLALALLAVFGWNWARVPLQQFALEKTGRELRIAGDLKVVLAWPAPRVLAQGVSFANPPWAKHGQMLTADEVGLTLDLLALLKQELVFRQVHLTRPVVFLELAPDGRKTWLLDKAQVDESARISIGRLTLDRGTLGYEDARQNTRLQLELSTRAAPQGGAGADDGVAFSASGKFKGQALTAQGVGGSVLALRDDSLPYPLKLRATIGATSLQAEGTITSLLNLSAVDIQLAVSGQSLSQLYPLLGIALPQTRPYATKGHILHSAKRWRYDKLTGHVGNSDIAGSMQLELGGVRPLLSGDLVSRQLDFADLGPLIGAKEAPEAGRASHMLPDIPFKFERWDSVDADVHLRATTILRAKALPLENLVTHLLLKDSQLTLNPLDFGLAGGHLTAVIALDGRKSPIHASTKIAARAIQLAELFPTLDHSKASIGQMNGDLELSGQGNSVGRMLATADGRVSLIVEDGAVSKLLIEQSGLHLLEILQLKLAGDKTVKLNCAVADFEVKDGLMTSHALLLDTQISTLVGTGSIDLGQERLDLTLVPKTRATSPVALRSPIHVRGSFSDPQIGLDKGRVAARGVGALALALVNPMLALIPLVEMGPGHVSECTQLIRVARQARR